MATVFFIDILNDFFATLVFKVYIYVRRLIPLFGDKALKQQIRLGWINLGDFEAIADGTIGGRAAALTENLCLAGKLNYVVDCQKVIFILKLLNQL